MEDLKKENEINIKLFRNWFIGSTDLEYQIYRLVKDKTKENEKKKEIMGHYSGIEWLLQSLPDQFIKHESNAKAIEEILAEVKFIKEVIVEFKNKYVE